MTAVFERTVQNLTTMEVEFRTKGHLPDSLMRDLDEDISKQTEVENVEGIPTYQYGVDDNYHPRPSGIARLLRFVTDE